MSEAVVTEPTLWLVKIHDDYWDYDRFASAVVWAESAEDAEEIMRRQVWHTQPGREPALWVQNPAWRLVVTPAPATGVVLVHWLRG